MHVIRAPRVVADSVPLGPACVAVSDGVIRGCRRGRHVRWRTALTWSSRPASWSPAWSTSRSTAASGSTSSPPTRPAGPRCPAAAGDRRHLVPADVHHRAGAGPGRGAAPDGRAARRPRRRPGARRARRGPVPGPDRHGAHDPALLRDPTPEAVDALIEAAPGLLRMHTLAPERPGGLAAIRRLVDAGVLVSIGHSDATAELRPRRPRTPAPGWSPTSSTRCARCTTGNPGWSGRRSPTRG